MRKTLISLTLTALAAAAPAQATGMATDKAIDKDAYTAEARQMAGSLAKQLGGALKQQLETGTPESAIAVCRDKAPAIAGEMSRSTGWRVTRVSAKTRNSLLGTPDEWEQGVLKILEARLAAGEKPEALEFSQLVDEPNGRVFRYMKGLPVAPLCTTCHGGPENMPEAVKARIAAEYPHDQAIGYKPGMLRGGISIKRPL